MTDPDRILGAQISGRSRHHATNATTESEAVADLRTLAAGRTDLLLSEAGAKIGGFLGSPIWATDIKAAYLLLLAADAQVAGMGSVVAAADLVRARAEAPTHSNPPGEAGQPARR